MAPKVFITGATGYIGGDALVELISKHPDWEYTCSVRTSDKGAKIVKAYPSVRLVYGDLDSIELLEEEAAKADIVYHFADCDHQASAEAISRGLARRQGEGAGFWIHTSGTLILGWKTMKDGTYGEPQDKEYNDWEGVHELISLPDGAAHRHVDKVVLAASQSQPDKIKTAIVCPCTIYGEGRGPDNQRSLQVYKAAELFMKTKQAVMTGRGQNSWNQIHVQDLSKLYVLLGEAAVAGGPPATWNDQGYYLAENGMPFVWGSMLQEVATEAHKQGFLPSAEVKSLPFEETMNKSPFIAIGTGTHSSGRALRAEKLLGWQTSERPLVEEIPKIIETEARLLGLIKSHAERVAM